MRFHWIRDRVKQGQFQVLCLPGSSNREDYFSKNHSPTHHRKMRPMFLQLDDPFNQSFRGCIETITDSTVNKEMTNTSWRTIIAHTSEEISAFHNLFADRINQWIDS